MNDASRVTPLDLAPDALDAPFWEGCLRQEFLIHRCSTCGRAYWPASSCPEHVRSTMEWEPASGRGEVHTYTVYAHSYDHSASARVPYVIAVIKLDEGPFFHTDLIECEPADVHVGMPVEVVFETVDDTTVVPHFRPVAPAG